MLVSACNVTARSESSPGPLPPGSATTATPSMEPSLTSVGGIVREVAASARVLTLDAPDNGFSTVALTDATRLIKPDGGPLSEEELRPGIRILAAGRPAADGGLLAEQVNVLP